MQIWLRSGPIFAYVVVTFDFNSIENVKILRESDGRCRNCHVKRILCDPFMWHACLCFFLRYSHSRCNPRAGISKCEAPEHKCTAGQQWR